MISSNTKKNEAEKKNKKNTTMGMQAGKTLSEILASGPNAEQALVMEISMSMVQIVMAAMLIYNLRFSLSTLYKKINEERITAGPKAAQKVKNQIVMAAFSLFLCLIRAGVAAAVKFSDEGCENESSTLCTVHEIIFYTYKISLIGLGVYGFHQASNSQEDEKTAIPGLESFRFSDSANTPKPSDRFLRLPLTESDIAFSDRPPHVDEPCNVNGLPPPVAPLALVDDAQWSSLTSAEEPLPQAALIIKGVLPNNGPSLFAGGPFNQGESIEPNDIDFDGVATHSNRGPAC